jgi:hypothetical protein
MIRLDEMRLRGEGGVARYRTLYHGALELRFSVTQIGSQIAKRIL